MSYYYGFRPYVPVAVRRRQAAREMEKLKKQGQVVAPVVIKGRTIARNFWGKAWCENLERYSDYANRLPRGRTYVRNGSVVDLEIESGRVRALVSGSEIYSVVIEIATVPAARWTSICKDCLGSIGSLVELLQGKLAKNVMERVCREGDGLFPSPREIKMTCSCPDWASMCKHVAAVLYGTGARLDSAPDLLFTLRGVDRSELIVGAGSDLPMTQTGIAKERLLEKDDVAALFGIDMATGPETSHNRARSAKTAPASGKTSSSGTAPAKESRARKRPTKKKPTRKRVTRASPTASAIESRAQQIRTLKKSRGVRTAQETGEAPQPTLRAGAKPGAPPHREPRPQSRTGAAKRVPRKNARARARRRSAD